MKPFKPFSRGDMITLMKPFKPGDVVQIKPEHRGHPDMRTFPHKDAPFIIIKSGVKFDNYCEYCHIATMDGELVQYPINPFTWEYCWHQDWFVINKFLTAARRAVANEVEI